MSNLHKEIIHTQNKHVSCNGLEAPYDHPMIYLEIDIKDGKPNAHIAVECLLWTKLYIINKLE